MILHQATTLDLGKLNLDEAIAVLPLGAVEQHSHHLPLGTDSLIVSAVSAAVESRRASAVVLLPTMWIGASNHHLEMDGSVSIGTSAVIASITTAALSLARSTGIKKFLLLNGHGGNQPAVSAIIEHLAEQLSGALCWGLNYWDAMFSELDNRDVSRPASMGHADEIETSLVLRLHPSLVAMHLASADGYTDGLPSWVQTSRGIPDRTAHGGVGDPTQGSAERGQVYLEAAVDGVVRMVDELRTR